MAQKELLLLVLAVVLVGLAVVAGIELYDHYASKAAADAEAGVDITGSIQQAQP